MEWLQRLGQCPARLSGLKRCRSTPPTYISPAIAALRFFLRTPSSAIRDRDQLPKGLFPSHPPLKSPAPRARLGPLIRSRHGGLHLHQHCSRFPGNGHLLAALSIAVPPQASRSRTLCRGLILPFISNNLTSIHSLRRRRLSPRPRHSLNPSILPLRKSRIFGHNRTCPLPIPTGTSFPPIIPCLILTLT